MDPGQSQWLAYFVIAVGLFQLSNHFSMQQGVAVSCLPREKLWESWIDLFWKVLKIFFSFVKQDLIVIVLAYPV